MSTIDTSTWNPDPALNESIGDIPLNESASISQTWQAIQMLMAAGGLHGLQLVVFDGATASADGASGLVPQPLAGDQDKVLKGDGTWGNAPIPNLGTASRAVVTDSDKKIAVSSVTATELGCLSGVTSAIQTQLDAKAADSGVVHLDGSETVTGFKTFTSPIVVDTSVCYYSLVSPTAGGVQFICGGSHYGASQGAHLAAFGAANSGAPGQFRLHAGDSTGYKRLIGKPDGTLTWDGQAIQTASDERLKTHLSAVPDAVLDAWEEVCWGQFRFLDAVERKGDAARLHLGLIAQRVKAVFEKRGLDACAYGILCHEEHEVAEDGSASDLWMVRYEEALAMEAACQRRRADRLEARIAALEERLNG